MAQLSLVPDPGVALGSNVDASPNALRPGEGRFLQDVLLDVPGIVRQRGALAPSSFPNLPSNYRPVGMTSLSDPNGTNAFRIAIFALDNATGQLHALLYGRATTVGTQPMSSRGFFELMEPLDVSGKMLGDPFLYFDGRRGNAASLGSFSALADINLSTALGNMTITSGANDPYFQASMSLDGGNLIGVGVNFGADGVGALRRAMYHWRGAAKQTYNRTAVTVTQNSAVLTDAGALFLANVEPGMFVSRNADGRIIGVVKSVDLNTQITMEQFATQTTGATNLNFISFRRPFVNPGLVAAAGSITTSITSAVVNGGGTKFVDQGVANGDLMFRESDFTFIGTVSTIQSNSQLTLTGNAAVATASEGYVITRAAPWSAAKEPVFSAFYNGIQLLANADNIRGGINERSRIFVTKAKNLEGIDLTKTGTFYDLPSNKPHTDIRGMFSTESAALVFLAEATYGLFGNDPTALSPKVVYNDGLLSPMTVQPYQGGAIWAGNRSIYWFDGATVQDLLRGRVSVSHTHALANLDYSKYRAWAMLHNRHYICFLQKINTGIFAHKQGRGTSTTGEVTFDPDSLVYCINLDSGAVTFWTNINVRGYTAPPGTLVDSRDAYFMVLSSATNGPLIASAEQLFAEAGSSGFYEDAVTTVPNNSDFSPHFYVEGGLHSIGDPELLKRFQMLLLQYSLYGGDPLNSKLGVDIVTNLSESTKALALKAATSTNGGSPISWTNKRTRFSVRANMAGIRVYTMSDGQPTAARLGPWSFGFKPMRVGRV